MSRPAPVDAAAARIAALWRTAFGRAMCIRARAVRLPSARQPEDGRRWRPQGLTACRSATARRSASGSFARIRFAPLCSAVSIASRSAPLPWREQDRVSRHMPTVLLCSSCARLRTTSVRCAAFPECGRAAWRRLLSVALSSAHSAFSAALTSSGFGKATVGNSGSASTCHHNTATTIATTIGRNNRQLPVTVGSKVVR